MSEFESMNPAVRPKDMGHQNLDEIDFTISDDLTYKEIYSVDKNGLSMLVFSIVANNKDPRQKGQMMVVNTNIDLI